MRQHPFLQPGCGIGDQRQAQHAHAQSARFQHFREHGHTHCIGSALPAELDFSFGFVARAHGPQHRAPRTGNAILHCDTLRLERPRGVERGPRSLLSNSGPWTHAHVVRHKEQRASGYAHPAGSRANNYAFDAHLVE